MWGISFQNIQMLLSDSVQVFYTSINDDKRKPDEPVLDMNNPDDMEKMIAMAERLSM